MRQGISRGQEIAALALGPPLFDALDIDRDGIISAAELASGLLALFDCTQLTRATPLISLFDSDSDGRLTRAELEAFFTAVHRHLSHAASALKAGVSAYRAVDAAADVPGGSDGLVSKADLDSWLHQQAASTASARADSGVETPDGTATPPSDQPSARDLTADPPVGVAAPVARAPSAPPSAQSNSPQARVPQLLRVQAASQAQSSLFSARPSPPASELTLLFSLHSRPAAEVIEDFAAVVSDDSLLSRVAFTRRMLRYAQPTIVRGSGSALTARPEPGSEAASADPDVLAVVDRDFVAPVQRVLDEFFAAFRAPGGNGESVDFVDFAAALTAVTAGSAGERMAVAFSLLDADGDGLLSRNELRLLLSALLRVGAIKSPGPEGPMPRERVDQLAESTSSDAFAHLSRAPDGSEPALISLAQFKEWYSRPSQSRAHAAARRSIVHADPSAVAAAAVASARHEAGAPASSITTPDASAPVSAHRADSDATSSARSSARFTENAAKPAPWRNIAHLHELLGLRARSFPAVLRHFSRYMDAQQRVTMPAFRSAVAELARSTAGCIDVSPDALADALFAAFSSYRATDGGDGDGVMAAGEGSKEEDGQPLGLTALVTGLSALMGGEHDVRVVSAFHLLDADGDGYLSLHDLRTYLRSVMPTLLRSCEAARAVARAATQSTSFDVIAATFARRAIQEADTDCDGKLSLHEFSEVGLDMCGGPLSSLLSYFRPPARSSVPCSGCCPSIRRQAGSPSICVRRARAHRISRRFLRPPSSTPRPSPRRLRSSQTRAGTSASTWSRCLTFSRSSLLMPASAMAPCRRPVSRRRCRRCTLRDTVASPLVRRRLRLPRGAKLRRQSISLSSWITFMYSLRNQMPAPSTLCA